MMAGTGWTDHRPKSPHLQVWRWHWTMAASIFHRATGVALYVGALLIGAWLVATASGPEAYEFVDGILRSWFGRLVLFGFTLALSFHFFNGIRYLMWDGPKAGFNPGTASAVSFLNMFLAVLATVGIFAAGYYL